MIVVTGTAIAQVITVCTTPVLTRMYTPDQFGVLSIFVVILSGATIVSCLCYEPAVVLPADEASAIKLLIGCILISALMAGFSYISLLSAAAPIARFFNITDSLSMLWWIPWTIIGMGLFQAFTYWNMRLKKFKYLAASRICQSGVTAAVQIKGGLIGAGSSYLIYGQLLGLFVAVLVLGYETISQRFRMLVHGLLRPQELAAPLNQYRNFPLYSTWGTLMNTAAFQCVPLLLLKFHGTTVVGLYFLASRVVSMPMSLIGNALGQVLYQRVSDQLGQGQNIAKLIAKVVGGSILVWTPPFFLLFLFSPAIFSIFFGSQWNSAGYYAQALIPLFLLQLITSPASVVLIALNKQHIAARLQAILLAVALLSLGLTLSLSNSPLLSLIVYSLCQCIVYFVYLLVIIHCASTSIGEIFSEMKTIMRIREYELQPDRV
ncbi:MAG: hypothetical protein A3J74_05710 [Elusimicrobia bacterium RIFCSPHIGHO2_02_FULL_57_9]|nr:MAG: hypothetical protein A3J74_05710 [Elusimicrobia bacterium RIFCSPHIGHO2_02_FULL_57_9]